jgi:cytochrome c biogenesis protein CcmG, thiol:disulfide interchange protein DsbE
MNARKLKFLAGGLILAALIGFTAWLYTLYTPPLPEERVNKSVRSLPPVVGSPVPDFPLRRLDGTNQQLSDLKGKPRVINFWATWCAPCKKEMPLFEKYSKKYADELVILGVNSEEDASAIKPFIKEMQTTFPIALDEDGKISDSYFVRDLPYTFFIDRDGILRAQHLGLLSEEQLVRYLQTIGIEQ